MILTSQAPAGFLAELDTVLKDPSGRLSVPSTLLLGALSRSQIDEIIAKDLPKKPTMLSHLGTILGTMAGGSAQRHWMDVLPTSQTMTLWSTVISHNADVWKYTKQKTATLALLDAFVLQRDAIGLNGRERALLRAVGALYEEGHVDAAGWGRFLARMVWNDGKAAFHLPKSLAQNQYAPLARDLLTKALKAAFEAHAQFIEESMRMVAEHRNVDSPAGRAVADALFQGARWLRPEDLADSRVYAAGDHPAALVIGYHREDGSAVRYGGDASLITIAAPNTGKTQGQVIPNLLTYPGSAFVLDVKGELWAATAAHRRAQFGPVYRFSPTSADGRSHRYNPFDLIGREPAQAANACEVLAKQIVPGNPHSRDPFWDTRARDFLWAFAMLVALDVPDGARNIATLAGYLSVTTNFEDNTDAIAGSPTDKLIKRLEALAQRTRLPELANIAVAFRDGLIGTRLGSVFDTARSHLNVLSRTPLAAAAMAATDWNPIDLRSRPGTTVYLSFKPGEMQAYAAIIRLIFQQHADALTRDYSRTGDPPITFFLDEMPQLGNLPALNDLLDVGRGAGVRLWMFAQYLGQLQDAYGHRANGIVGATQIRCFMQPDNEAAKFIEPQLGRTRNIVTGEECALVEAHELASRVYGDHVIVLARNEHPALLTSRLAYQTTPELMAPEPPEVPRVLSI